MPEVQEVVGVQGDEEALRQLPERGLSDERDDQQGNGAD